MKKVNAIELLPEERLVAVIAGRNRHLRLLPLNMMDKSDVESIKIEEAKGCISLASGAIRQGSSTCLCVAVKKYVATLVFTNNSLGSKIISLLLVDVFLRFCSF